MVHFLKVWVLIRKHCFQSYLIWPITDNLCQYILPLHHGYTYYAKTTMQPELVLYGYNITSMEYFLHRSAKSPIHHRYLTNLKSTFALLLLIYSRVPYVKGNYRYGITFSMLILLCIFLNNLIDDVVNSSKNKIIIWMREEYFLKQLKLYKALLLNFVLNYWSKISWNGKVL